MNTPKVMIYGIVVVSAVSAMLAFKVRTPDVCAYSRVTTLPSSTTICNRISTGCVTSSTIVGASNEFAVTNSCIGIPCPPTAVCYRSKAIGVEQ